MNIHIMPPDPSDPCHMNKPRDGDDLFFRTSSDLSLPTPNNSMTATGKMVSRPLIRAYSLNSTGSIMRIPTLSESLHTPYGDRSRSRSAHFGPGGRRKCHSDSDMYTAPRAGGVRFDRVEIREYNRAVGDNPSCSGGAPIGLSWEYNPEIEALPLEDYEDTRGPRRTSKQMAMPRSVREEILRREWGAKQSDMAQAVRENLRIKNSRRRTVNNLDTSMTKVEEKMEGVKKSLKKSLGLRKSFRKQYDQWQSQAQEAAALAERLNAEAMIAEENAAAAYIAEEEARSTAQVASENDVARLSLSSDAPDSFLKVHPVVIKEEEEGEEEAADGEQDNPALASEPIINCDNAPITKNTVLPTKTLDSSQSSGAPTYEAHHSVNRLPIKATRRSFSSQMA